MVGKAAQRELDRRKRGPAGGASSLQQPGGAAFGAFEGLLQLLVGRVLLKETDQRAVREAVRKAVGGAPEARRLLGEHAGD